MSGNFDGTSFDGSLGGFDVDATGDTHDWVRRRVETVRSFEEENRRFEELRGIFRQPVEPEIYEAIKDLVPEPKKLESGRVSIDWEALGKDVQARVVAILDESMREYDRMILEDDEEILRMLN